MARTVERAQRAGLIYILRVRGGYPAIATFVRSSVLKLPALLEVTPGPLQTPPPRRPSPRRAPPPWAPSWAPRAAAPTPTHRVRAPTFRRAPRQRPRCPPAAAAARSARRAGAAAGKASGRRPGSGAACGLGLVARASRATARARDTVGASVRVRVRVGARVGVWARVEGEGGREADRRRSRRGRGRGAAARRRSAARGGAALQLGHLALHLLPRVVTLAQHPRHGLRTRLGGLGGQRGGRRGGLGLGGLGGTLLDRHLAIRRANLLPRRLAPRPGLLLPLRCQRLVPQTLVLLRSNRDGVEVAGSSSRGSSWAPSGPPLASWAVLSSQAMPGAPCGGAGAAPRALPSRAFEPCCATSACHSLSARSFEAACSARISARTRSRIAASDRGFARSPNCLAWARPLFDAMTRALAASLA